MGPISNFDLPFPKFPVECNHRNEKLGKIMKVFETSDERSAEFLAELLALLHKYNATLDAADHYRGYAECGEDVRMTVSIPATWDSDNNMVCQETELNLGKYVQGYK